MISTANIPFGTCWSALLALWQGTFANLDPVERTGWASADSAAVLEDAGA